MTAGVAQRYQYVVPEFTPPEAEGHLVVLHVMINLPHDPVTIVTSVTCNESLTRP